MGILNGGKGSLRAKLLLPTIVLLIAGSVATVSISYMNTGKAVRKALTDTLRQNSGLTADQVSSWLGDQKLNMASWSGQSLFTDALDSGFMGVFAKEEAGSQLAEMVEQYAMYSAMGLADQSGVVVASSDPELTGVDISRLPWRLLWYRRLALLLPRLVSPARSSAGLSLASSRTIPLTHPSSLRSLESCRLWGPARTAARL